MSEPDWRVRERMRRLIEASSGCTWLEPIAKITFGALLLAGVVIGAFLLLP